MYSNVTFSVTWRPDFRHRICNLGSVSDTRSDKSHWDGNQFKLTPSSVSAASLNTVFVLRYSVKIRMLCISASLEVRDVVCEEIILSVNREVNGVYLDFFFFSVHPGKSWGNTSQRPHAFLWNPFKSFICQSSTLLCCIVPLTDSVVK